MSRFLFVILLIANVSYADPLIGYHETVCSEEQSGKKITVQIDGVFPDEFSTMATVQISKDIDEAPYQVLVSSVTNAHVEKLQFEEIGTPEQSVNSLKLDLGRSGKVKISGNSIQSTLMQFYFPKATELECFYSFVTGPRPISGGN